MRRKILSILILVGIVGVFFVFYQVFEKRDTMEAPLTGETVKNSDVLEEKDTSLETETSQFSEAPLDRASERVTKKPFGIFVSPENSPVSPERFRGYHSGTDFEAFPEEEGVSVPVRAACSGAVVYRGWVSGYGGVVITECVLDDAPVTVLYGHLALTSIAFSVGDRVTTGDILGSLGEGGSSDTDGERKHLHFSIHKGESIDYRGYVQDVSELDAWFDPCVWVCEE